jgi:hypothetical protein
MPRWQCLARISLPAEIVEELDRSADFDGRDFRVGHAERAESVQLQTDQCLMLFGNGDGGGGPTPTMLEKVY